MMAFERYRTMGLRADPALAAMHLQWFAAEDEGRTEEPTEHKIRKAREEGKVAKSMEVSSAVVLLFAVATLAALGPYYLRTLRSMMVFFLRGPGGGEVVTNGSLFPVFLGYFVRLAAPVALARRTK